MLHLHQGLELLEQGLIVCLLVLLASGVQVLHAADFKLEMNH